MDVVVRAVGILIERFDDKILILRRKPEVTEGDLWGIVGGDVAAGEKPLHALIRRTKADVNLDLNLRHLYHLKTFVWQKPEGAIVLDTYKIRFDEAEVQISLNSDGHSEFQWIDPKECFKREDLMDDLYEVLKDAYIN